MEGIFLLDHALNAVEVSGQLLAFALELILMVAVADRPWRYCFLHWIDLVIVLMPAVEMFPLFRLLRMGRILRLENLLRWGRLHRLQALLARCWRAILVLQIVQRLTGRSAERQLEQRQALLQAKEEELTELRREIKDLEERIAHEALSRTTTATCSRGTEEASGTTRLGSPGGP